MVVNQAFAERYWPGGDAIGNRLRSPAPGTDAEIVGVVANFKLRSLREMPTPVMFAAATQYYLPADDNRCADRIGPLVRDRAARRRRRERRPRSPALQRQDSQRAGGPRTGAGADRRGPAPDLRDRRGSARRDGLLCAFLLPHAAPHAGVRHPNRARRRAHRI